MTDPGQDPQTQLSDDHEGSPAEVVTGAAVPTPEELNAQEADTSQGDAVSGLPTDEHPGDVDESRQRVEWDADTDPAADIDPA